MSYIFWNIKVTGKCALMIDMSTRYDEYPKEGSDFSYMRDSLYILCIMNQYTPKQSLPPVEAEKLLRLTLFSNYLPFLDGSSLLNRRTELAQSFREGRKKGVIPVFISFLWFVFALALSIQFAFSDIGGNETAHNLALGFLVGWLPILIMASTVDRNLVSADAIREKLNVLVNDVRIAVQDEKILSDYMRDTRATDADYEWVKSLNNEEIFGGDFFQSFGGQGRSHWHYGVAHPILTAIETKFLADYGRAWLLHGHAARVAIVTGSRNDQGLKMFDPRMIWQIMSSFVIVAGTVSGSFILSYFTPTAGLGCRTGGYMVYMVIAMFLLLIELIVWWVTHETTHTAADPLARVRTRLERRLTESDDMEKRVLLRSWTERVIAWIHQQTFRDVIRNFVIRPGEITNTGWLAYIVFAQTFGSYQTCDCMASTWASTGGFIDFSTAEDYKAHGIYLYWGASTALACFVMSGGLAYIVHEYCTQSHFSTEHYGRAMQGLRLTRAWKRYTRLVRVLPDTVIKFGKLCWFKVSGGKSRRGRRSLVWTPNTELYRLSNLGYRA